MQRSGIQGRTPDMVNYRRIWMPGGTFFFTLALRDRSADMLVRHIDDLRQAFGEVRSKRPWDTAPWWFYPTTYMRYGRFLKVIVITRAVGKASNRLSCAACAEPALRYGSVPEVKRMSGNEGSGSTAFAMKTITRGMWITFTSTR